MSDQAKQPRASLQKQCAGELSDGDLDKVTGGTDSTPTATTSNIMKTKNDTAKNTISNIH